MCINEDRSSLNPLNLSCAACGIIMKEKDGSKLNTFGLRLLNKALIESRIAYKWYRYPSSAPRIVASLPARSNNRTHTHTVS